jgi:hypothetical protein
MIAGRPEYDLSKAKSKGAKPDRLTSVVAVALTIIIVLATHLIMALDVDDARLKQEDTFRRKLSSQIFEVK